MFNFINIIIVLSIVWNIMFFDDHSIAIVLYMISWFIERNLINNKE